MHVMVDSCLLQFLRKLDEALAKKAMGKFNSVMCCDIVSDLSPTEPLFPKRLDQSIKSDTNDLFFERGLFSSSRPDAVDPDLLKLSELFARELSALVVGGSFHPGHFVNRKAVHGIKKFWRVRPTLLSTLPNHIRLQFGSFDFGLFALSDQPPEILVPLLL